MGKIDKIEYLLLIARLILAAVFIYAAFPKIQDPVAFATSVEAYRVVSGQLAMWVAIVLPWLELFLGVGILAPQLRRSSGILMAALLFVFILLHISAWMRGLDISCGCFGESRTEASPNYFWLVVRNFSLLLAAICVARRDFKRAAVSR